LFTDHKVNPLLEMMAWVMAGSESTEHCFRVNSEKRSSLIRTKTTFFQSKTEPGKVISELIRMVVTFLVRW